MRVLVIFALWGLMSGCGTGDVVLKGSDDATRTFCNPMNIDYGASLESYRHAADPVIVLFRDKYYLFTTDDIRGYRVSDDLLDWDDVLFDEATAGRYFRDGGLYTAPGVASDGEYMYFVDFAHYNDDPLVPILRTNDPQSGHWEKCGEIPKVADPSIFFDNKRMFIVHGLGAENPIRIFEVDTETFTAIPGTERQVTKPYISLENYNGGYMYGRREITDDLDTKKWLGNNKMLPCPEGPWLFKNNGIYYLQFAVPGTASQWYADVMMESDNIGSELYEVDNNPLSLGAGSFDEVPYNPVSMKAGGFIGGAGHSCVFRDKNGLWWQVATQWIGILDGFERRIGLFPVKFSPDGKMQTFTAFGDYPMPVENRTFDSPNMMLLSYSALVTASSETDGFGTANAADENIRTAWSAQSGDAGEWLQLDMGDIYAVGAVQVNFFENGIGEDYHAYKLLGSKDGQKWTVIADKSESRKCTPHDYVELETERPFRYIRIENVHMAFNGKFALSDLRVFGHGGGKKPASAEIISVERLSDRRFGTVKWTKVPEAEGYVVRFGIDPNFMNQSIRVTGNDTHELTTHILMYTNSYFFRVDAFNKNGVTEGSKGGFVE